MTLYHNSPRTGKAARCRAKAACPFGTTHGTTIRKDGTVEVGSASPTWKNMKNPPARIEERVIIGEDGKATMVYAPRPHDSSTDSTTVQQPTEKPSRVGKTQFYGEDFVNGYPAKFSGGVKYTAEKDLHYRHVEFDYHNAEYIEFYSQLDNPNLHYQPDSPEAYNTAKRLLLDYSDNSLVFILNDEHEAREEAEQIATEVSQQYTNDSWFEEMDNDIRELRAADEHAAQLPQGTWKEDEYGRYDEEIPPETEAAYERFSTLRAENDEKASTRVLWTQPLNRENVVETLMNYWKTETGND